MVGHRPQGREAGRAEEVAQRLSKFGQLATRFSRAENDAIFQTRKRSFLSRHFTGKNQDRRFLLMTLGQYNTWARTYKEKSSLKFPIPGLKLSD